MKYKIVATDFDGTLLSSNKEISMENIKALKMCKENNCLIIGITARNLSSVKGVCDIEIFDYLILNNGAYIYKICSKKGECVNFLSKNLAKDITEKFIKKSDRIDYCSVEKYYSNKTKILNKRPFHILITDISEIDEVICRMNIFGKSDEEVFLYKKYIDEHYPNVDTIIMQDSDSKSNKKWLAINAKGCNKATSLEKLTDSLNYEMKDVIFFGDGMNDIEILSKVGLGVSMGNALPEVKKISKDTTVSNNENGIAVYLNKFLKENVKI